MADGSIQEHHILLARRQTARSEMEGHLSEEQHAGFDGSYVPSLDRNRSLRLNEICSP